MCESLKGLHLLVQKDHIFQQLGGKLLVQQVFFSSKLIHYYLQDKLERCSHAKLDNYC